MVGIGSGPLLYNLTSSHGLSSGKSYYVRISEIYATQILLIIT